MLSWYCERCQISPPRSIWNLSIYGIQESASTLKWINVGMDGNFCHRDETVCVRWRRFDAFKGLSANSSAAAHNTQPATTHTLDGRGRELLLSTQIWAAACYWITMQKLHSHIRSGSATELKRVSSNNDVQPPTHKTTHPHPPTHLSPPAQLPLRKMRLVKNNKWCKTKFISHAPTDPLAKFEHSSENFCLFSFFLILFVTLLIAPCQHLRCDENVSSPIW